jgi:FtsZ-interacting cell division protein ZipA
MPTPAKIIVVACWVASAALCRPAFAAPPAAGVSPGDDAMTCEQIATELAPYAQQLQPNLQALMTSTQQQYARGRERYEERKNEAALMAPMATAGALDPTGASKRAYVAAEMARTAKHKSEDEAEANSPLAKQANVQIEQLAAQGQQLQGNARLQRLMQLGHQKGCDKKK